MSATCVAVDLVLWCTPPQCWQHHSRLNLERRYHAVNITQYEINTRCATVAPPTSGTTNKLPARSCVGIGFQISIPYPQKNMWESPQNAHIHRTPKSSILTPHTLGCCADFISDFHPIPTENPVGISTESPHPQNPEILHTHTPHGMSFR